MILPNDQIVIISGSSRGLGLELVKLAINDGYLVIGCSRTETDFCHANYQHAICDITDERSVIQLFLHIRRKFGAIHALINNAGVIKKSLALLSSLADFDECYRVNVMGAFIMSREAAKVMRKTGGRIVNITTTGVKKITPGSSAYVSSKCAVEGMTRVMAEELCSTGITVNAVGPGLLDAGMVYQSDLSADEQLAALGQDRLFSVSEVWLKIAAFLGPEGAQTTGRIVYMEQ